MLYNAVMLSLEPDLLTRNLPTLDEKYSGESAKQHKSRIQRYKTAFARFDAILKDVTEVLTSDLQELAKSARKALRLKEQTEKTEESQKLEELLGDTSHSAA